MKDLKSREIEGQYINQDRNKSILVTWETETLLVLDFHDSAQRRFRKVEVADGLLGTLRIEVE